MRGRGVLIVLVCLSVAAVALFVRIEQSSCVRSNQVREPLNATAASFSKISVEYKREAGEADRYSPIQRADFLTRSRNLGHYAATQHVKSLDCSLPLPQR